MNADSGLMAGKKGLIMGVANERSIAWHIANATSKQGAELAFTYQGDALLKRVTPLAASIGSDIILQCDVTDEPSIDTVFSEIHKRWGKLDFIVHAIAYSDKDELKAVINALLETPYEELDRLEAEAQQSWSDKARDLFSHGIEAIAGLARRVVQGESGENAAAAGKTGPHVAEDGHGTRQESGSSSGALVGSNP